MAIIESKEFRDSISTVDKSGERVFLHPKKPKGKWHNRRLIVTIVLLAFMFGMPFIEVGGHPFFLFNIIERKFILFGMIFWPQDFHLFALAFLTGIVSIVFFTVLYGRIFCGWLCPQTIFMEMVFRKVEYLIDGDYTQQRKLANQKWDTEKVVKRTLKHTVFFGMSVLVSNTFLAWIIGKDELFKIISEPIADHIVGFSALLFFSGAFYWVFAWFREQVCIIACPYGRLQGVMLDENSLVVAYDYKRGEPRGPLRKDTERTEGDCIDCKQCVHVCPTGIDIRNGTQLECVNCTACIDACDDIMEMIDKPKGLIGFYSEKGIEEGDKFKLTARNLSYSIVLFILMAAITIFIFKRDKIEITLLRERGSSYIELDKGYIRNMYNMNLLNKTFEEVPVTLKLENMEGIVTIVGRNMLVPEQGSLNTSIAIDIPEKNLDILKTEIEIGVYDESGSKLKTVKTNFLGPGL